MCVIYSTIYIFSIIVNGSWFTPHLINAKYHLENQKCYKQIKSSNGFLISHQKSKFIGGYKTLITLKKMSQTSTTLDPTHICYNIISPHCLKNLALIRSINLWTFRVLNFCWILEPISMQQPLNSMIIIIIYNFFLFHLSFVISRSFYYNKHLTLS